MKVRKRRIRKAESAAEKLRAEAAEKRGLAAKVESKAAEETCVHETQDVLLVLILPGSSWS